jgi:hypothetical protein
MRTNLPTSRWLLANRRYFGLAFAVGAFCQVAPITVLALRFQPALADIHSASSQFGEGTLAATLRGMSSTKVPATQATITAFG